MMGNKLFIAESRIRAAIAQPDFFVETPHGR